MKRNLTEADAYEHQPSVVTFTLRLPSKRASIQSLQTDTCQDRIEKCAYRYAPVSQWLWLLTEQQQTPRKAKKRKHKTKSCKAQTECGGKQNVYLQKSNATIRTLVNASKQQNNWNSWWSVGRSVGRWVGGLSVVLSYIFQELQKWLCHRQYGCWW